MTNKHLPTILLGCAAALAVSACDTNYNERDNLGVEPAPAPTMGEPAALPGTAGSTAPATALACDPVSPLKCNVDADCGCGLSRATGECAIGTLACVDTSTTACPQLCGPTGIGTGGATWNLALRCVANVCTQVPM